MNDCQVKLMKHLDKYIGKIASKIYPYKQLTSTLYDAVYSSSNLVGRLVCYYPAKQSQIKGFNNWTGWHRDFGICTGLTHPIYFKENGERINIKSGLLIKNKRDSILDVCFNEDDLIIQAGDCAYFLSGGIIIATPHSVKIREGIPNDVFRITYVNFLDPEYEFKMKLPYDLNPNTLFEKDPFNLDYVYTKWNDGCEYKDFVVQAINSYIPKQN